MSRAPIARAVSRCGGPVFQTCLKLRGQLAAGLAEKTTKSLLRDGLTGLFCRGASKQLVKDHRGKMKGNFAA